MSALKVVSFNIQKRGDAVDGAPRLAIRRILEDGYVDCYRRLHPRTPGFTYPSDVSWLRLDYIFASPALAQYLDSCDVVATLSLVQAHSQAMDEVRDLGSILKLREAGFGDIHPAPKLESLRRSLQDLLAVLDEAPPEERPTRTSQALS